MESSWEESYEELEFHWNRGCYLDWENYCDSRELERNRELAIAFSPTSNKKGEAANSKGGGVAKFYDKDWGVQKNNQSHNS